jgi:hypothetical protein
MEAILQLSTDLVNIDPNLKPGITQVFDNTYNTHADITDRLAKLGLNLGEPTQIIFPPGLPATEYPLMKPPDSVIGNIIVYVYDPNRRDTFYYKPIYSGRSS